jgi:putative flippase GtrA
MMLGSCSTGSSPIGSSPISSSRAEPPSILADPGRSRVHRLFRQLVRYGLVGLCGLVVDLGVFNALRLTVFAPDDVAAGPLLAKLVSSLVSIVVVWLGNRLWTFGETRRPRAQAVREALEFFAVALGGMAIGLICLFVSHYLLGFTSPLADNVSSNVVGLVLGTAFRFTLYKLWVFHPARTTPTTVELARA